MEFLKVILPVIFVAIAIIYILNIVKKHKTTKTTDKEYKKDSYIIASLTFGMCVAVFLASTFGIDHLAIFMAISILLSVTVGIVLSKYR